MILTWELQGNVALKAYFFAALTFFAIFFWSGLSPAEAEEPVTIITAEKIEFFGKTRTYVASGAVSIASEGTVVRADEITYYEDTSEVFATGTISYEDKEASVKAAKAELNLAAKTGRLYDAEVFYKKYNYHLRGKVLEKRSDKQYTSPEATFTTCDAPIAAWCFRGKQVDAIMGDRVLARDSSFHIRNIPVFYTPYLRASLVTERQTGFLMPLIGNSKTRGLEASVPFYWLIAGNQDATFVLDEFSKRGTGTGIEYRLITPDEEKSNWWIYHIRDKMLEKDILEVRGLHEYRRSEPFGGFLSVNYVNEITFYRDYSSRWDVRTLRYLESTGEIQMRMPDARLYLLSQYWVDLKNDTKDVPQKLPEIGYVLPYRRSGDFLFSASLNAVNIVRERGVSADRVDFFPKVLYTTGTDITLSQTAGLRTSAYSFSHNEDAKSSLERLAFEYDITAHTRLTKKYEAFLHVIEPSVRYHLILSSENDLPVFDSTELFQKTSNIEMSLLNRAIVKGKDLLSLNITAMVDTYNGSRPFLPLKLELGMKSPLPVALEATIDPYSGNFETVTSNIGFNVQDLNIYIGERYNRSENILMYSAGIDAKPYKWLSMTGGLWYDAKGAGLRDASLIMRYKQQCWGIRLDILKQPGNFTTKVMVELAGFNTKPGTTDAVK